MNILIADNAGFCFGVKRAMNMAWNELDKGDELSIYALGPLIHNKQAVAKYEERGMMTVDTIPRKFRYFQGKRNDNKVPWCIQVCL